MSEKKIYAGSCYCGAVQFEASHPIWCGHCHCSICRRLHGAPYTTWAAFAENDLKLVSGKESQKVFHSSSDGVRTSCEKCGAWLFFRSSGWPDVVEITLTSLSDVSGLVPVSHVFYADRASWININDGLPRYSGETGTPLVE